MKKHLNTEVYFALQAIQIYFFKKSLQFSKRQARGLFEGFLINGMYVLLIRKLIMKYEKAILNIRLTFV
jgi:hypothetical protein